MSCRQIQKHKYSKERERKRVESKHNKQTEKKIYWKKDICCVFRPVNGCSARRLLVKINFSKPKQLFPSLTKQNKEKRKESRTKTCNKRVVYQGKGMILSRERRAEWPFPGQNTQHPYSHSFYSTKTTFSLFALIIFQIMFWYAFPSPLFLLSLWWYFHGYYYHVYFFWSPPPLQQKRHNQNSWDSIWFPQRHS